MRSISLRNEGEIDVVWRVVCAHTTGKSLTPRTHEHAGVELACEKLGWRKVKISVGCQMSLLSVVRVSVDDRGVKCSARFGDLSICSMSLFLTIKTLRIRLLGSSAMLVGCVSISYALSLFVFLLHVYSARKLTANFWYRVP